MKPITRTSPPAAAGTLFDLRKNEPRGVPRNGPQDARHVALTRGQRLAQDAAEAAEVRAWQTHPDVVALRVERIRSQVDRLCWAGIVLGLAFTMTNVQVFAASGAGTWSLPWLAAWVLDPTVSLVLIAVLRAEQVTSRHQVRTGRWVRAAKWFALAATYVMNTWQSWAHGSAAGVVLHSVPPLLVFVAAEAVTDLRDKLTDAVTVAVHGAVNAPVNDTVHGHGTGQVSAPAGTDTGPESAVDVSAAMSTDMDNPETGGDGTDVLSGTSTAGRRRGTFTAYRAVARQAWTPGVVITPAWVREVTGCSRGLSSRLAASLSAELTDDQADRDDRADAGEVRP